MNAERLHGNSHIETSPKPIARRNIFSTVTEHQNQQTASSSSSDDQRKRSAPIVMTKHQSISSSSSSSSSPQPRQSFTSDTSVIDTHWLQKQRIRDANTQSVPPPTYNDRSTIKQVYLFICHIFKTQFMF
jgi:hypothetical protein